MKKWFFITPVILILLTLFTFAVIRLFQPTLTLGPKDRMWIEGNSTLHHFTMNVTRISVESHMDSPDSLARTLLALLFNPKGGKLVVKIPVEDLKSDNPAMDKNTDQTMKAGKFPDIVYTLGGYHIQKVPGSWTAYSITANGSMQIAGRDREIQSQATLTIGRHGLHLYGRQDIFQKDFGIKPYVHFLILSVANKITAHFDLWPV